jgi:hypothetical protein
MTEQELRAEIHYLRGLVETHLQPVFQEAPIEVGWDWDRVMCPICKATAYATKDHYKGTIEVREAVKHEDDCYFTKHPSKPDFSCL